ncbi:TPA: hypothetical protein HMV82_15985 [Escherichia coli]|jgi:hypothetical protein|uniref:Uncharacterized protein n=13 Tax=Enterobacteriaceae TaxID=543 RepID=J7FPS4_CITFR|nr:MULTISPECIES: hypothetical protein [Enterobacteriaceae]AIX52471.1 hypothetical protein PSNIH1_19765 [Pantoea sp. PSNIH1]AIX76527.1 hypothetical protein PSNIH2_22725 [Pantoea sp. PSNIH2]AUV04679.1 hypothetical protein C2U51_27800 [Enterobacteriaceae bacterium ENNIH1]EAB6151966.1 hypothetical protein [Salmonella enterica]EBC9801917.1 hypothetical protein [Salmonella enterica subsp. enterica serovar Senftenberg]EBH9213133.1 hypothetical protein [Salmonella enterica subsp. enterica serovar Ohi
MKLATDLVNAVLIKDGVVPVSITEMPVQSLVNPLTQVHLSLYLKTTHLSRFVPDYVETLKDCPVSYDIGLELQQCISSAELLCEDMESLEFISVWIELYTCNSKQQRFEESNFSLRSEDIELAKMLACSHDLLISQAACFWLLYFDDFMRYVRNRLCTLLREVLILIAGLRNAFLHRNEDQLIKRVKYGNEMLEVTLKAIALCSMDRYLKSFTSLRTEAAASGFIKCVKSYISTGWRHGYIVCHYYRNGQSLGKSLPLFISETSEYSIQKRVNRLISSTISGRNKDLGLSDF